MAIARKVDDDNDWLFGKGKNDYIKNNDEVAQNIKTRLGMFLGDCFFDQGAGIDWFNALGTKDQIPLNLFINAIILNTPNVTGIVQLLLRLDTARNLTVRFKVQTTYSVASGTFQYSQNGAA